MWLVVLAVAVTSGAALALMVHWRRRDQRGEPTTQERTELDPRDLADVAARFGAVESDVARRRAELLASRLRPLVDKRVPVRLVEPVPQLGTVRIRFADGTAVMGRGDVAGDAGVLAKLIRERSVWPGSCSTDERGTHLVFAWSGSRKRLSVLVSGLDQPD